jgi:peptidyl-dipeptidase Dcp
MHYVIAAAAGVALSGASGANVAFTSSNPFYSASTLLFHAPPFDKIRDSDYQPAIEAGMTQQMDEIRTIANNPEPPTFQNTIVALEKSGRLLDRVTSVFDAITSANTNDDLVKIQEIEAP